MSEISATSLVRQMREIVRAEREAAAGSRPNGVELLRAGEYEKAVVSLREEAAAKPDFYYFQHYLGEALYNLKRSAEAEIAFVKSAELNPYYAPTQAFLGDTAFESREYKRAEAFYRRAVELQPELFRAHKGLLKVFYKLNDGADESKRDEAEEIFARVGELAFANRQLFLEILDLGLPDAKIYNRFGDFFVRGNQIESAIVCYQLAVSLEPENAAAWLKIAGVFFDAGESEYAAECQSKAANLQCDSVEIQSLLGEIWNKRNRYAEAVAAYRQAAKLDPTNAELRKVIGDLQTKQGLIDDAQVSYERAIELGYKIY